MPVNQVQKVRRGVCRHGPERHPHPPSGWHRDAASDGEDRVKHRARGAVQRGACHGCPRQVAAASDEPGTVGLVLKRCGFRALNHGDMGGPDLGLAGAAAAAGGDQDAKLGMVIGDDEHFGEGRVRKIGGLRGKHQLDIRGQVDLARAPAGVGQRDPPGLGVVFGRHHDLGGGRQAARPAGEGGLMFAEDGGVLFGHQPGRLHARRPPLAGLHIAQVDEGPKRIQRRVRPPPADRDIAPAAEASTCRCQHHPVPSIR